MNRRNLLLTTLAAAAAASAQAVELSLSVTTSFVSSVGSVTGSLRSVSNSSTPNTQTAAAGEYRVVAWRDVDGQPERVQMQLEPLPGQAPAASGLALELPRATVQTAGLVEGDVVAARQRPFGIEFARLPKREVFFLVLHDDWFHELQARRVGT